MQGEAKKGILRKVQCKMAELAFGDSFSFGSIGTYKMHHNHKEL